MSVTALPVLNKIAEAQTPDEQKKLIWEIVNRDKTLSKLELFGSRILVAVYARPKKVGSIFMPDSETKEDEYQGKVGLLIKKGPDAYRYTSSGYNWIEREEGEEAEAYTKRRNRMTPKIKDWIVARPASGEFSNINIGGVACRIFDSAVTVGRVKDPRIIF